MMHKDTMLTFGWRFDLAKYLGHTQKFRRTGYGRGLVASKLNFGTPSLSRKLIELGCSNLAHLLLVLRLINVVTLR